MTSYQLAALPSFKKPPWPAKKLDQPGKENACGHNKRRDAGHPGKKMTEDDHPHRGHEKEHNDPPYEPRRNGLIVGLRDLFHR